MRQEDLAGRVAVVTGGSRGIGRHIAHALHDAGCVVAVTSRHKEELEAAARAIGVRCHPYVCDQTNPDAIADLARRVPEDLGAPDILVNNAGTFAGGRVLDTTLEQWNKVIETNLTGVFLTTKAFLPAMIDKGRGDVFMISSMSGKKGDPGGSAYAASKFGLQGFSQALLYEVRKHNIRVTVLNPSSVDTGDDTGPTGGSGLHLHAADLAGLIAHLAATPSRTLIRDVDLWGTNP